jgi:adenylate cyclase class 2
LGARLIQPRTHEINLRFDTPKRDFQREHRVLRLRQDRASRLTYKDGTVLESGAFSRREIEFAVSDFDSARQFIEALGYEVVFTYEKYRTPYGDFVEIEGEMDQLKPVASQLGLNWEAAIPASYHELFDRVCAARKLTFRDLTYENFKDIHTSPLDLDAQPADT